VLKDDNGVDLVTAEGGGGEVQEVAVKIIRCQETMWVFSHSFLVLFGEGFGYLSCKERISSIFHLRETAAYPRSSFVGDGYPLETPPSFLSLCRDDQHLSFPLSLSKRLSCLLLLIWSLSYFLILLPLDSFSPSFSSRSKVKS
jgi:hypothetical protein